MMPDNWSFVAAAYGLAAVVLIAYWRFLARRERELGEGGQVADRYTREHPRSHEPTA